MLEPVKPNWCFLIAWAWPFYFFSTTPQALPDHLNAPRRTQIARRTALEPLERAVAASAGPGQPPAAPAVQAEPFGPSRLWWASGFNSERTDGLVARFACWWDREGVLGCGNEPGDSLKGNHGGWFLGVIPSFLLSTSKFQQLPAFCLPFAQLSNILFHF